VISAEQHAKIRQLISEGADPAQITERLNVDAAAVIAIAQLTPPSTGATGQPIYRHRKYQ
jgi:hypothetical protein